MALEGQELLIGTEEHPFSQRWSPRTRLGVTRRAAVVLSAIEEIPPQRETMALKGRELLIGTEGQPSLAAMVTLELKGGVTRRAAGILSAMEETPPQRETVALIGRELPTVTGARSCLPASGAERDRRVKWRGNRCGVCD